MEARERLAIRLAHADGYELRDIRSTVGPEKDASLWRKYLGLADAAIAAFHLSDTAALALMDDPGIGQKLSMAMTFKQEIARRPQGVIEDAWVIRKRGYFYRATRSGYTSNIHEAGRYSEADARKEASIEPWHIEAINLSDALAASPYKENPNEQA